MNSDDIIRILDELGERLGPAGQRVFELAVRQVFVNGITVSILLIGYLVLGWFLWRKYHESQPTEDIGWFIGTVLYAIVGLVLITGAIFYIPAMLNPEYAALRELLTMVRS